MKYSTIIRSAMLTLLVAASGPASAYAQGGDKPQVGRTAPGAAMAPSGASRSMAVAPVNIPSHGMHAFENVGQDKAKMGVGLAAIVVGIIAGGEIGMLFIIAGGIMGLIGLYNYMR